MEIILSSLRAEKLRVNVKPIVTVRKKHLLFIFQLFERKWVGKVIFISGILFFDFFFFYKIGKIVLYPKKKYNEVLLKSGFKC